MRAAILEGYLSSNPEEGGVWIELKHVLMYQSVGSSGSVG